MLKVCAYITMLIDHIGLCFFPEAMWMRAIGRVSAPIFAYGIAVGYWHTMQKGTEMRYLKRIGLFALVSQIPYVMMTQNPLQVSIGGTFFLSLLLLIAMNRAPLVAGVSLWPLVAALILAAATVLHVDGGAMAVLMVLQCFCFIVRPGYKWWGWTACVPLHIACAFIYSPPQPIYILAALAYPIICLMRPYDRKVVLSKRVSYAIYPVHMAIFGVARLLLCT